MAAKSRQIISREEREDFEEAGLPTQCPSANERAEKANLKCRLNNLRALRVKQIYTTRANENGAGCPAPLL